MPLFVGVIMLKECGKQESMSEGNTYQIGFHSEVVLSSQTS